MKAIFRIFIIGLIFIVASCQLNNRQKATAQTAGNDPTIKRGESFSYSKLVKPKIFDFICFQGELPTDDSTKYLMVYRLCGMPGDKVQIKDGDFYLNNKLVDGQFSLKHNYLIPKGEFERIKSSITIDENFSPNFELDTLVIPIDDKFIVENKINAKRQILSPVIEESEILRDILKDGIRIILDQF